jgi:hypothetical protein
MAILLRHTSLFALAKLTVQRQLTYWMLFTGYAAERSAQDEAAIVRGLSLEGSNIYWRTTSPMRTCAFGALSSLPFSITTLRT